MLNPTALISNIDEKLMVIRNRKTWTLNDIYYTFKVPRKYAENILDYAITYEVLSNEPDKYGRYTVLKPLGEASE